MQNGSHFSAPLHTAVQIENNQAPAFFRRANRKQPGTGIFNGGICETARIFTKPVERRRAKQKGKCDDYYYYPAH